MPCVMVSCHGGGACARLRTHSPGLRERAGKSVDQLSAMRLVALLYFDIVGFTALSAAIGPLEVVVMLDR